MQNNCNKNSRRVLLEAQNLLLGSGTGIATYARGLARALSSAGYRIDALVASNRTLPHSDQKLADAILFDGPRNYNLLHKGYLELRRAFGAPFGMKAGMVENAGGFVVGREAVLQGFERIHAVPHLLDVERLHFNSRGTRLTVKLRSDCDIFHATRPAPIQIRGVPNVYTIHDIVPLRMPYATADDKAFFASMIRDLCKTADHIVTVSEFSRQDIMDFAAISPDRITNTYQAVAFPDEFVSRTEAELRKSLRQHHDLEFKDYYLYVGAIEPKKNVSRLIDAYAASGTQRPLAVAGGLGWMYEADLERINSERFLSYTARDGTITPRRRVRRLSYLPLQDIVDLIRGARALLYPSVYEGFGLPVAEAMLMGTPVLTSNVASLPEIAGDGAMLVDPYDVDAIAQGIRQLDSDDDLIAELSANGAATADRFSPEKFQQRMSNLYDQLV
ncbi:MAG: glycosyltransferase family 4 protein [Alphaproteobacteria bacterium]|nr:glycosyltransferase family 4 protein [Alphaproteobacteria bacterium]